MSAHLLESLLYIGAVTAASLVSAIVLYAGIKQSTDFISGSSNDLMAKSVKVKFRLGGAIAGYVIIMATWLYFVPYSTAVPSVEVWVVSGKIEKIPPGVEGGDIRMLVLPPPTIERNLAFDTYVIREKDVAGEWRFPSLFFEPASDEKLFEPLPVDLSEVESSGLTRTKRVTVALEEARQ